MSQSSDHDGDLPPVETRLFSGKVLALPAPPALAVELVDAPNVGLSRSLLELWHALAVSVLRWLLDDGERAPHPSPISVEAIRKRMEDARRHGELPWDDQTLLQQSLFDAGQTLVKAGLARNIGSASSMKVVASQAAVDYVCFAARIPSCAVSPDLNALTPAVVNGESFGLWIDDDSDRDGNPIDRIQFGSLGTKRSSGRFSPKGDEGAQRRLLCVKESSVADVIGDAYDRGQRDAYSYALAFLSGPPAFLVDPVSAEATPLGLREAAQRGGSVFAGNARRAPVSESLLRRVVDLAWRGGQAAFRLAAREDLPGTRVSIQQFPPELAGVAEAAAGLYHIDSTIDLSAARGEDALTSLQSHVEATERAYSRWRQECAAASLRLRGREPSAGSDSSRALYDGSVAADVFGGDREGTSEGGHGGA